MCFKCKTRAASFANKQDSVCRDCFLDIFVHRFKSSLRTHLKIWKDDLNLICVSGGSNSMALLDLVWRSLFGSASQRKMFFRVHVLFIEEGSAVYGWSHERRTEVFSFIADRCHRYGFTYTVVPLEAVYDVSPELDLRRSDPEELLKLEEEKKLDEANHATPSNQEEILNIVVDVSDLEAKRQRLRGLIQSLPADSSFREDLILYLKRWVIADFALRFNFKKVLLGTSGHKVATQLLAQIAKGRGASVPHEISYVDDKNFGGRVTFMNPMREFLHKEIGLFNYLSKVEIV